MRTQLSLPRLGIAAILLAGPMLYAQTTTTPPATPSTPSSPTAGTDGTPPTVSSDPTEESPAGTPRPLPKVDPSTLPDSSQPRDPKAAKKAADAAAKAKADAQRKTDSLPSPGEDLNPHIKAGSEDDVNAIGTRSIGGRGLGNWYSTDWEITINAIALPGG